MSEPLDNLDPFESLAAPAEHNPLEQALAGPEHQLSGHSGPATHPPAGTEEAQTGIQLRLTMDFAAIELRLNTIYDELAQAKERLDEAVADRNACAMEIEQFKLQIQAGAAPGIVSRALLGPLLSGMMAAADAATRADSMVPTAMKRKLEKADAIVKARSDAYNELARQHAPERKELEFRRRGMQTLRSRNPGLPKLINTVGIAMAAAICCAPFCAAAMALALLCHPPTWAIAPAMVAILALSIVVYTLWPIQAMMSRYPLFPPPPDAFPYKQGYSWYCFAAFATEFGMLLVAAVRIALWRERV